MTINYQNPPQPYPGYGYFPPPPQGFSPEQNPYLADEQSYVENILRLNKGKFATVYMSFEGSQWGSKIFRGTIIAAGKDHIILKDQQTNATYLLLTIYLSYVTFDEDIEYEYPYE
ncbi:MAG: spore coat protein GerQ [Bacilli bacterium]|jgi:spore germination protein Q|nr:spore coat protein GerQ [Bacilli bacterium]